MSAHPTPAAQAATLPLPALGQPLHGGVYAGVTTGTDGALYALVLLPDKPAEDLDWPNACSWAAGLNAHLPTRPEAALLYALLAGQFEKDWHWTSEVCSWNSSCAWVQHFINGRQLNLHKSYAGRARAVRRFPLQSFVPSVAA